MEFLDAGGGDDEHSRAGYECLGREHDHQGCAGFDQWLDHLAVSAAVQAAFTVVQAPQGTCIVDYSGVATAESCTPPGALSSTTLAIHPNPTVAGHGFLVVVSGEYYANSAAGCSDNSSSGTSNTYTLIPSAHAYVNLTN